MKQQSQTFSPNAFWKGLFWAAVLTFVSLSSQAGINADVYSKLTFGIRKFASGLQRSQLALHEQVSEKLPSLNEHEKLNVEYGMVLLDFLAKIPVSIPNDSKFESNMQGLLKDLLHLKFEAAKEHHIYFLSRNKSKDSPSYQDLQMEIDRRLRDQIDAAIELVRSAMPNLKTEGPRLPLPFEDSESVPLESEIDGKLPISYMKLVHLIEMNDREVEKRWPFTMVLMADAEGPFNYMNGWGAHFDREARAVKIEFRLSRDPETRDLGIDPNTITLSLVSKQSLSPQSGKMEATGYESLHLWESQISDGSHSTIQYPAIAENGLIKKDLNIFTEYVYDGWQNFKKITYEHGKIVIVTQKHLFGANQDFEGNIKHSHRVETVRATIETDETFAKLGAVTYEKEFKELNEAGETISTEIKTRVRSTGYFRAYYPRYPLWSTMEPQKSKEFIPLRDMGNFTGAAFQDASFSSSVWSKQGQVLRFPAIVRSCNRTHVK